MADKVLAPQRTRQAIAAAESGEIKDARNLLSEALTLDPEYEPAWLWFAAITEDQAEKKYCLERAKSINPVGRAARALESMRGVKKKSPVELRKIIDPDPPEFEESYVAEAKAKKRRKWFIRGIAGGLVTLILAGLAFTFFNKPHSPVYIAVVAGSDKPGAGTGQEKMLSTQWSANAWNASNVSGQHELILVPFFDNNDVEKAKEVANEIVADGRFAGVVGHDTTSTSEAAGPIYKQAGIPVITPTATGDQVTAGNEWYFRTVFDNTAQGNGIATYISSVLKKKNTVVVNADSAYGASLADGFENAYKGHGTVPARIQIDESDEAIEAGLDKAAAKINSLPDPEIILIAGDNPKFGSLATKLTGKAANATIVGTDGLAVQEFYEEIRPAGTKALNRAMNSTPNVRGTLPGPGASFLNRFEQVHGYQPSWMAITAYDAIQAFGDAIDGSSFNDNENDLVQDRINIRDYLASANSLENAIQVLSGWLYFSPNRSAVAPVSFVTGRIESDRSFDIGPAPLQLANYSPAAGVPLNTAVKNGTAIQFNDSIYTLQRIVQVGVNYNYIENLDLEAQTYNADFFIWFRYEGDTLPFIPQFVNAVDQNLGLGEPQKLTKSFEQTYALYRVNADFKAQLAFNDFPFDQQQLQVTLQAKNLPAAQLSFAVDGAAIAESQETRLRSGIDPDDTIDRISNWKANSVNFYTGSIGNTASMGDPTAIGAESGISYSVFASDIDVSRDIPSFLIKNLLPLLLLATVGFLALWLPMKETSSRISFGATGILTGAVMLTTVTSSLPQVDYTVAIEWAYYTFIALSVGSVFVTLVGRRLLDSRKLAGVRILENVSRVIYPVVVVLVALLYWIKFH